MDEVDVDVVVVVVVIAKEKGRELKTEVETIDVCKSEEFSSWSSADEEDRSLPIRDNWHD